MGVFMYCINNEHFFHKGSISCVCGYWKNGVAPKPPLWEKVVLAMVNNGCCGINPEIISEFADTIVTLSQYHLDMEKL